MRYKNAYMRSSLQNNKTVLKALTLLIIVLIMVSAVSFSFAQFTDNDLQIEVVPNLPGPHVNATIRVRSYSYDLDRSQISWLINGVPVEEGIGLREISFTTGDIGNKNKVDVVVQTLGGQTFTKSVIINPLKVNIIWEALSYTPPFYKGKALVPPNGFMLVTAMPELVSSGGTKLKPEELVYTWEQDGFILGESSGFGRNSVVVNGKQIPRLSTSIAVTVASFDNTLQAQTSIKIPVSETKILFYEKHPLEGILYEKALEGEVILQDAEITVRGEPMYFSLDDIARNNLTFRWEINNRDVNTPLEDQGQELVLRNESGAAGSARVSLSIESDDLLRVLQDVRHSFNLRFGI